MLQKIKATRTSKPVPPPPAPKPAGRFSVLNSLLPAASTAPAEIFGANGQILDAHSRRLARLVDARVDQDKQIAAADAASDSALDVDVAADADSDHLAHDDTPPRQAPSSMEAGRK